MIGHGILIFAGTAEGRAICQRLNAQGVAAAACVATDYGARALDGLEHIHIVNKRLNREDMARLIEDGPYRLVVDATHPYAQAATENIRWACRQAKAEYIRLLRRAGEHHADIYVEDTAAAVAALEGTSGNILLTTGCKDLPQFCGLEGYKDRLFARVLPCAESLEQCGALGLTGRHVIAMQGPFSHDMNVATLRQLDCRYIVTKNTGSVGGLEEKLSAAEEAGAVAILIDRPLKETGLSLEETAQYIFDRVGVSGGADACVEEAFEFFPLFVPSTGRKALVVGGGQIAARRVASLRKFKFEIDLVAPRVTEYIQKLADNGGLRLFLRPFAENDLDGCHIVVAATDDRGVNSLVGRLAKCRGLLVSVADAKEECNYYFPAVITGAGVVAGLTSDGKDHGLAARAAKKIRGVLT